MYEQFLLGEKLAIFCLCLEILLPTVMGTVYKECVSTVPLRRKANYLLSLSRNLTSTVMGTVYTECGSTVPLRRKANYFLSLSRNRASKVVGTVFTECV